MFFGSDGNLNLSHAEITSSDMTSCVAVPNSRRSDNLSTGFERTSLNVLCSTMEGQDSVLEAGSSCLDDAFAREPGLLKLASPALKTPDFDSPSAVEIQTDLRSFSRKHMVCRSVKCFNLQFDPNLDQRLYNRSRLFATGEVDVIEELELEMELAEDSPYPEVRSAVPNTDDPTMECVRVSVKRN